MKDVKVFNGKIFDELQIVFIVLKLTKVINWNWVLVLSPSLINLLIYIVYMATLTTLCKDTLYDISENDWEKLNKGIDPILIKTYYN